MLTDNLTQTAPDAVAHNRSADPLGGNEASAECLRTFVADAQHAHDEQHSALGFSFGFHAKELSRSCQPFCFRKRKRDRRFLVRHVPFLHLIGGSGGKIVAPPEYSKNLPADELREDFARELNCYCGLGLDVVVLVEDDDSELPPVAAGDGMVVFVVLLVLELEWVPPPAGEGFTIVVLFSVFFSAPAGVTLSVFCSQAAKSAALAKMQMYFFIGMDGLPVSGLCLNRS